MRQRNRRRKHRTALAAKRHSFSALVGRTIVIHEYPFAYAVNLTEVACTDPEQTLPDTWIQTGGWSKGLVKGSRILFDARFEAHKKGSLIRYDMVPRGGHQFLFNPTKVRSAKPKETETK